jgi:hypothetical protein
MALILPPYHLSGQHKENALEKAQTQSLRSPCRTKESYIINFSLRIKNAAQAGVGGLKEVGGKGEVITIILV